MRLGRWPSRCGQLSCPQQGCCSCRESLHVGRAGAEGFTVVWGHVAVPAARQRCSQLRSRRWSGGCSLLGCLHACYFTDWISWTVTLIGFHAAVNELSRATASVRVPDSNCSAWQVAALHVSLNLKWRLLLLSGKEIVSVPFPFPYIQKTRMCCALRCHLQSGLQRKFPYACLILL